ncbi:thioesterase family protein [Propioniciclava sp.]|uniref:acyl-CoA thioesterase n=1 Tax=Propioniciclava sp. TaxID=2038686 RepID=UPI00260F339E|nr:thioesterase family protein [Propioniciclava sp.]
MTNTEPRPAGGLSATVTRRVEWIDTDASGHHHNALVWRLAESAERALLAQAGVLEEYFWAAPRVHQEADFTATLHFDQEVTCTLTVEKLGRASITFAFEVWGEARDGEPRRRAASGRIVAAHVPSGAERAAPWPPTIAAALDPAREPNPRPTRTDLTRTEPN